MPKELKNLMEAESKVALAVGALGVIGRNLIEHLSGLDDWEIVGLSRRAPDFKTKAQFISVNLHDPDDCREKLGGLRNVTGNRAHGGPGRAVRPSMVCGFAVGNPMNLAMLIAVYAALSKELGIPLRYPGNPIGYTKLTEVTTASLLAKATVWAATEPKCGNEAFNIANGDLFRWEHLWPKFAEFFGMEYAPLLQLKLTEVMADKELLWNSIVQKYSLQSHSYKDIVSWQFGDFTFGWDYDMFADTTKSRRFGFQEFVDTEEMFLNLFSEFQHNKIIP